MNEDNPKHDDEVVQVSLRLSGYAKGALLMFFLVYLGWAVAGGIDAQIITMNDPALSGEMDKITAAMIDSKEGVDWQSMCITMMNKITPRMHWFADAFISGVLTCALVGWMLGKWVDNPRWAGLLPILYIFSGINPACLGDGIYVQRLPLEQQFLVLAGQCTAAHLMAYRAFEKRYIKFP